MPAHGLLAGASAPCAGGYTTPQNGADAYFSTPSSWSATRTMLPLIGPCWATRWRSRIRAPDASSMWRPRLGFCCGEAAPHSWTCKRAAALCPPSSFSSVSAPPACNVREHHVPTHVRGSAPLLISLSSRHDLGIDTLAGPDIAMSGCRFFLSHCSGDAQLSGGAQLHLAYVARPFRCPSHGGLLIRMCCMVRWLVLPSEHNLARTMFHMRCPSLV